MTARSVRRYQAGRRAALGRPLPDRPEWTAGHADPRHPAPHPSEALFGAYYEPPVDELVHRGKVRQHYRPPRVRITGPIIGHVVVSDPDLIRSEAARLLDVAATIDALIDAFPYRPADGVAALPLA